MELDQTSNERSWFGALFPEIPVEAERQALYMSLLVGALVFSAIMGWGPHGRWLNGLGATKATKSTASMVATPRNMREGNAAVATSDTSVPTTTPVTTQPAAGIPGPETTEAPAVETAAETAVESAAPETASPETVSDETSSQGTVTVAPATVPVTEAPPTEVAVTEAEVGTSTTVIDPLELSPTLPALDTAA